MDWQIVLLHTRQSTLLKRVFEVAFPERVTSIHVPGLARHRHYQSPKRGLLDYFDRNVYDSGIWGDRVLTIYGDGEFHHWTYALVRMALERRGLRNWTYFHFDQHRDDWDKRDERGLTPSLHCANFVDQIAHDFGGTPFMVGPEVYPKKDAAGYKVCGRHIPIYHNYFTKELQQSRFWRNNVRPAGQTGLELPSARDLRATPTEAYLTFDLDLLSHSEIVTNYDQNDDMTLRRVCQILDKVRPYKRVFSADILGFPDHNEHHALSCLTMVILARKIMGLGVDRLLKYHTHIKQRQVARFHNNGLGSVRGNWDYWSVLNDKGRESPIEEGELMEVL